MAGAAEDKDRDALKAVYHEVCASHNGIADFRAKLLGLLPLASGVGVFLLLGRASGDKPAFNPKLLAPIGIFGFVVTFGLFMYELRGIQDCVLLRERAGAIERKLKLEPQCTQFGDRGRGRLGGLVDEIGAGWIIYLAVLASWLFVAAAGLVAQNNKLHFDHRLWSAGAAIGVAYVVAVAVGLWGRAAILRLTDSADRRPQQT